MKFAAFVFVAGVALAQQPAVSNAQVQTRAASPNVAHTIDAIKSAQTSPAWIGYAVPIVAGDRNMCCYDDSGKCGCSLESGNSYHTSTPIKGGTVQLEGPTHLVVLYRVANHNVQKVRTFTPQCALDAGGLPFYWLTDVRPAESVQYLTGVAQQLGKDEPVAAIAFHNDPAADQALEQFLRPDQPEHLRRQAVFWLALERGHPGFEAVKRVLRDDPSDNVRDHAVFALTQSNDPEAMTTVMQTAHNDRSTHVRGQALFWLAQRAGAKVAGPAISDAIANDPEADVKKKAVFALTQIPNAEGVPLLIQVAKTNHTPAVRKEAVFWLGQSKDPRALTFIEDVLTK